MSNHEICSNLELCESLPVNQKNSCYKLVKAENLRHDAVLDHIGEGVLILLIFSFGMYVLTGISYLIKNIFDQ